MSVQDSLWTLDDLPDDDLLADWLFAPEIKRHLVEHRRDDELGLRELLARPEALSSSLVPRKNRARKRSSELSHAA